MVTYTYNRFKGTTVYGTFQNSSRTDITDVANAIFDGHVTITGDLSCNGNVAFNSNLPTSTITPTLSTNLITKAYADATYSATGGTTLAAVQSNNNTFTGTNTFNNGIGVSNTASFSSPLYLGATSGISFTNATTINATALTSPLVTNGIAAGTGDGASSTTFNLGIYSWYGIGFVSTCPLGGAYCYIYMDVRSGIINSKSLVLPLGDVQTQINTKTTLAAVQSNNNAFTGTTAFNTTLPTSTVTPTLSTNLITKAYADATYSATGGTTLAAVQSNNNTFTGVNTYAKDIVTNSMTIGLGNGSLSSNCAFGNGALGKTTGGYNLAIGGASLFQNLGGIGNTGVGYQALAANTTGNYNMGFGYCSLNTNQTGSFNIGIGTTSLVTNLIFIL